MSGEDSLGFVYISLQDIARRKSRGAYYTPEKVVNELIERLYFGFSNAQEWIRTTFETIEKSRNVIMHSGVLDELDVARVGMNIIDWLHQINA